MHAFAKLPVLLEHKENLLYALKTLGCLRICKHLLWLLLPSHFDNSNSYSFRFSRAHARWRAFVVVWTRGEEGSKNDSCTVERIFDKHSAKLHSTVRHASYNINIQIASIHDFTSDELVIKSGSHNEMFCRQNWALFFACMHFTPRN